VADPPTNPPTERSDRSGTLLAGRYRFERRIAVGGMAEVWEAVDQVLDRAVAIKVLHPHLAGDQTFVDRFRREAIAAARLTHPSIVAIYDTHSSDGEEAIVMELVRGISLRKHLDDRGPLPTGEAIDIAARVAEALESAHRAGLVHRDIKPANILLCEDARVMVADFGIAKLTDADHTTEGTVLGTAKYLAPEQVSGTAVDARTDLYSLGIVLYEMVCGRVPFSGDTDTATVLARLHRDPTPPREIRPDLSPALESVILHALQRDPDDRPASAATLRTELLAAVAPGAASGGEDPTFLESTTPSDGTSVVPPPPPARAAGPRPPTGPPADRARVTTPPPPTGRPAPAPAPERPRNWTGPALLIGLVLAALAVAGVLLGSVLGDDLLGGDEPTVPGVGNGDGGGEALALTAAAFDPEGDGTEHDGEAPLAVDGDLGTAWTSEEYNSREDFQGIKSGVGLTLTLDEVADLGVLGVDAAGTGWSAQVFVADAAAADLAGWGEPVAEQRGIDGPATFDLAGHTGGAILLWITDLGTGQAQARINEVGLSPG
jgi:hypothetical protein